MAQDYRNQKFSYIIEKKLEENQFIRFDDFIIARMGYSPEEAKGENSVVRKEAYHAFLQCVSKDRPATLPTIRRWFGIHGFMMPSREQVFRIAFAMGLGVEETKQYLQTGIGEPSFQINDYTEMIAMYGLENHWDYTKYIYMVQEYERGIEKRQEISREANTQWLFQQFEQIKHLTEEEFMYWMWKHAKIFKGYSRTVQEYLSKYRELVLEYMRRDVKNRLDLLLSETGYESWHKKRFHNLSGNELDQIRKYVKWNEKSKSKEMSEHLGKNILELAKLVYSENGQNTKLMSELFAAGEIQASSLKGLPEDIVKVMTSKHLSDLFHIPEQNEIKVHTRQAIRELEGYSENEDCPDYIREMICQYSRDHVRIRSAGEALEWLKKFDRERKRRRLIVKRGDLLPMILYVSQQKYMYCNTETGGQYRQEDAKKVFLDLANATLIACNMPPLDETYMYDMILLACFQENEMYGYGDVLELVM